MTTTSTGRLSGTRPPTDVPRAVRRFVGGFYLTMAGVHLGIVASDTETYRHFADGAFFEFVRTGWAEVFMRTPAVWGLALFLGEVMVGALLLAGGRAARVGWVGVITFHVLLMLFGFGIWLWSIPVLVVLVPVAVREWRHLGRSR